MKLSTVIDTSGTVEREIPIAAETDFVTDVSMLFEEYWAAPKGAFLEGLCQTVFFTRIGDPCRRLRNASAFLGQAEADLFRHIPADRWQRRQPLSNHPRRHDSDAGVDRQSCGIAAG
jgi:hypothetical protein